MASAFIGYTVVVTLQNPPNAQVQGVVSDVLNQKLFLRDVLFLWNGQRFAHYTLDSSAIADLEIAPSQDENELLTPTATVPAHSSTMSTFVDPAILSYNKPMTRPLQSRVVSNEAPVSPIMIADSMVANNKVHGLRGVSSLSSIATAQLPVQSERRGPATATLSEPFDALAVNGKEPGERKAVKASTNSQTGPGIIDMKDMHGPLKQKKPGKGKGWRNTPLLEETQSKPANKRGRIRADDPNGWATEDATDIQDMGDFDFESNLSKFDKRRVFDDIRKDDKIAESERLVSFNRKARPGTNGGRNLHFTENVLGPEDLKDSRWKSEAGETEDDDRHQEEHYSSGKGTKRAGSRKPTVSRKGSLMPGHIERTGSPRGVNRIHTTSPLNGSASGVRASFRLANNKPCSYVSPLQMLEIEQLCTAELGLTDDMLAENAGRSIAEAVLKSGEIRNVLFLVGNHKSGARAIAAARHLRNRRLRVTVCVLGGDREESLFEIVRKQLNIYKKGMGYVERWDDYQSKLANGSPSPDIVVDALLGIHVAFEELRTDDQATVFEMIKWANRGVSTLSIDVPSGLSATSGLTTEVDGQSLMMESKQIVCLSAPKSGLFNAMAGDVLETKWTVFVADIGISTAAWQKHGSRRKQGTEFGTDWVIPIKLVAG